MSFWYLDIRKRSINWDLLFIGYKGITYQIEGYSNIIWYGFQFWYLKLYNRSNLLKLPKYVFYYLFWPIQFIYFIFEFFRSQISDFINFLIMFYFKSLYRPYFVWIRFAICEIIIIVLFCLFSVCVSVWIVLW
jgi:hypothetical protein